MIFQLKVPVGPDWAIFTNSWQQIVSQKYKYFGDFLGYF